MSVYAHAIFHILGQLVSFEAAPMMPQLWKSSQVSTWQLSVRGMGFVNMTQAPVLVIRDGMEDHVTELHVLNMKGKYAISKESVLQQL